MAVVASTCVHHPLWGDVARSTATRPNASCSCWLLFLSWVTALLRPRPRDGTCLGLGPRLTQLGCR